MYDLYDYQCCQPPVIDEVHSLTPVRDVVVSTARSHTASVGVLPMLIASGDESAGASSGTNGRPQQPYTNSLDEDDGGDDSSEESSPLILRSSPNGSGAGTGYRVTVYARQCLSTTNLDQLQHEGCTSKGKGAEKLAVREPERSPPGMLGASNYSYECPLCLESHASSVDDEGDDEGLSSISCGHVFGTKCIRAALRQDPRCPLCRVPAPKGREGIRRVFL